MTYILHRSYALASSNSQTWTALVIISSAVRSNWPISDVSPVHTLLDPRSSDADLLALKLIFQSLGTSPESLGTSPDYFPPKDFIVESCSRINDSLKPWAHGLVMSRRTSDNIGSD